MWTWMMLVAIAWVPAEEITFRKEKLDDEFYSEGVAVVDVDRDGRLDVIAGDFWYRNVADGDWQRKPLRKTSGPFDGLKGYSQSFANFVGDFNNDGWPDVLIVGFPGAEFYWYENPQGKDELWKPHLVWRSACNESPIWADLLGDGKPGLIIGYQPEGQIGFLRPGEDPYQPWTPIAISEPNSPGTHRFWHGLGVGDLDQDGRKDVLIFDGWWKQPEQVSGSPWKFTPTRWHPPKKQPSDPTRENPSCADIFVYDVDGDGDMDVVCSSAHAYGIWWHEQRQGDDGPYFVPHVIREDFSQTHALQMGDINGDGVMDIVTGKRFWAHGAKGDPGSEEPAVLYWIEIRRTADGPEFISHQIDDDSGVGTQFVLVDLNQDGLLDIVTSNKKGTQVFLQQRSTKNAGLGQ